MLFQIVDDILDVTGDEAEMGKPRGSDERLGKRTYVSVFGLERARELAAELARDGARRARRGARALPATRSSRWPTSCSTRTTMTPKLLDEIDGPEDLKGLDDDQLGQLAQEVREFIIDTVGEIGGHFGANLGTCELAVALHSAARLAARQDPLGRRPPGLPAQGPDRPPRRAADDPQVRRPGAVLLDRDESEHDIMGAGHASTAVSYAVGIKEAMRKRRRRPDGTGRRGGRRRRDDRRRQLRGAPERGRPRHCRS